MNTEIPDPVACAPPITLIVAVHPWTLPIAGFAFLVAIMGIVVVVRGNYPFAKATFWGIAVAVVVGLLFVLLWYFTRTVC